MILYKIQVTLLLHPPWPFCRICYSWWSILLKPTSLDIPVNTLSLFLFQSSTTPSEFFLPFILLLLSQIWVTYSHTHLLLHFFSFIFIASILLIWDLIPKPYTLPELSHEFWSCILNFLLKNSTRLFSLASDFNKLNELLVKSLPFYNFFSSNSGINIYPVTPRKVFSVKFCHALPSWPFVFSLANIFHPLYFPLLQSCHCFPTKVLCLLAYSIAERMFPLPLGLILFTFSRTNTGLKQEIKSLYRLYSESLHIISS